MGKDGFTWWIGQIAPAKVWRTDLSQEDTSKDSWAYRCKVRIIGYHIFDRTILKDDDLPWAHVMSTGGEGAVQGGLGNTLSLTGGETAFGFFMDGEDAQQPVIVGCLHRNQSVQNQPYEDVGLRPFAGQVGPLEQGPTQTRAKKSGAQIAPTPASTPVEGIGKGGSGDAPPIPSGPGAASTAVSDDRDKLIREDSASQRFGDEGDITINRENGCSDNLIGKLSTVIQDFVKFISRIQETIGTYIDPILNEFVDIVTEIRGFARRIVGVIKFIINNMRGAVINLVTSLFRDFIAKVLPLPQHPPVAEATKNITNIIFCLFEKIIPQLIQFLVDILSNMVGKVINAPLCAVEEFVAAILAKAMTLIEDILGPVMSGLDWLLGGLSQITGILSQVSSLAQQILNFIGCDQLKCETSAEWSSKTGSRNRSKDSWSRTLEKMNFMKGINENIDDAIGSSSLFGYTGNTPFKDCSEKVNNPKKQDDVSPRPTAIKFPQCLPPEVIIFGDGVQASAVPIIGTDGTLLSVELTNKGKGYTKPPSVNIIDNTSCGNGGSAESVIKNGEVVAIYITNAGSGYKVGDYSTLVVPPTYLVTADKYTVFEGDSVNLTILTTNIQDGTKLKYEITGDVTVEELDLTTLYGDIEIQNNSAKFKIKVLQDSIPEPIETLRFNLFDPDGDAVATATIIVANKSSPILPPELNAPVEAPPGTSDVGNDGGTTTQPSDPNAGFTTYIGITTGGVILPLPSIGIGTEIGTGIGITVGTGVGGIRTDGFSGGIGTNPFGGVVGTNPGIGTNIVGVITSIIITKPGVGYTYGDTIVVGDCVFDIITTPFGNVVGVTTVACKTEYNTLPDLVINSDTGSGAKAFPVLKFVPKFNKITVVNQVGVLTYVDCV